MRLFGRLASCAVALGACVGSAQADAFKGIAKDLERGAERGKIGKAAVLPFVFVNRPVSAGPVLVSERLTTLLSASGRLQVVERSLLSKVLSENRLALTGALDSSNGRRIGKVLNVDAVVCGTLVALGDGEVEVNARLIRADDGAVVAAASGRIKEDWAEPSTSASRTPAAGSDDAPRLDLATVSVPEALYRARCATCHGRDGEGGPRRRGILEPDTDLTRPAVQRKPDAELAKAIERGGGAMPAQSDPRSFVRPLSEREVHSLVDLIRALGAEGKVRLEKRKQGRELFERHCAVCHGFDGRGSHLASGLFEVPRENLDLTKPEVTALDDTALRGLLMRKKRRMLFRADMDPVAVGDLWLYLQSLAKP